MTHQPQECNSAIACNTYLNCPHNFTDQSDLRFVITQLWQHAHQALARPKFTGPFSSREVGSGNETKSCSVFHYTLPMNSSCQTPVCSNHRNKAGRNYMWPSSRKPSIMRWTSIWDTGHNSRLGWLLSIFTFCRINRGIIPLHKNLLCSF